MLTKEEFNNIISLYPLDSVGLIRPKYLRKFEPALGRKEILIIKGIRRSGKSTIMKQLIQRLFKKGVYKNKVLYVNFDDYNFLPYLNVDLLNFILSQLDLKSRCYLFLEEVQRIPNFESWLRTQYERGVNVKFIISGSTLSLLSKELSSVLTGRNLVFEVFPFDYGEFGRFSKKGIDEFISYGGFPEVVLEKKHENKLNLLRSYVSDIINKDILQSTEIRDRSQFLYFAQYILKNPGLRVSINKLSKQLQISKDTVKSYIQHLIDSYLIFEVPFFSHSAKSKFIASNAPKYYTLDNGFYLVNSPRKETGKQFEAVVAQKLFREKKELFYWKGKKEVDFVADNEAYNVVSSTVIPDREFIGLNEIDKKFKHIKKLVLLNNSKEGIRDKISLVKAMDFL